MSEPIWDVRLRIVSESLSVAELTAMIGVLPDQSSERGSFRRGSSLARRFSSWEIESGLDAAMDVTTHVFRVIERMSRHVDTLRKASDLADGLELAIVGRFRPSTHDNPGVGISLKTSSRS